MEICRDSGRTSSFEAGERRHVDYGYAVTSHSSQGQTAGRVLVHVETERSSEKLVNQRLAYVAVSRGQYDARIYTDDKVTLARALDREVSHRSALERTAGQASRPECLQRGKTTGLEMRPKCQFVIDVGMENPATCLRSESRRGRRNRWPVPARRVSSATRGRL